MQSDCYHCGLAVPRGSQHAAVVLGELRNMCCPGCVAVATSLVEGGYEQFYAKRTAVSQTPEPNPTAGEFEIYNDPGVQRRFVRQLEDNLSESTLLISGINCGACLWLIESSIGQIEGVESISVNYSTRRANVIWNGKLTDLVSILRAFTRIGYRTYPYQTGMSQALADAERSNLRRRIGIAGVFGMQIMMIATALYFGEASGMVDGYKSFFRSVSMILAVPVVLYSAQPFFVSAWSGTLNRRITIDVPVALGIGLAFISSVWATISGSGDTYFEAVAMFVFLLLSTRLFELNAREKGLDAVAQLGHLIPAVAIRIGSDDKPETIPAANLVVGDNVLVRAGDSITTDGVIISGATSVNESVISGESAAITKAAGDQVIAGSVNLENTITVRTERNHDDTTLSVIARLTERAQSVKPGIIRLVDRVAIWFVIAVVIMAAVVGVYCWWYAPHRLVTTMIAVLVIACPCALSLATPAALSASMGMLIRTGIILLQSDVLSKLPTIDHIVFDKTGTLTEGAFKLDRISGLSNLNKTQALEIVTALEASSNHPIAGAIIKARGKAAEICSAKEVESVLGGGVKGAVHGKYYYFGSVGFIRKETNAAPIFDGDTRDRGGMKTICILANKNDVLAVFEFRDELKCDALQVVNAIRDKGITASILSGDREQVVAEVAAALSISEFHSELSPADKLRLLRGYQKEGRGVVAVGDGINDAPALAAATVGIAMGSGADLATSTADAVLLNSRLSDLDILFRQSSRTRRIVVQNLIWAIGYNLVALPLGIMGMVPPWVAVIGMSLSSLIVVANALRLSQADTGAAEYLHHRAHSKVAYA